jgi:hypothetical protein
MVITPAADGDWRACTHELIELTGSVKDIDGNPARNARVSWYGTVWDADCRVGQGRSIEASTDSAGVYHLSVPAGSVSLWIETSDRIGSTREAIFAGEDLRTSTRRDYAFRIFRIEGRVLGPGGIPLAHGRVQFYPDPGGALMCGTGLPETSIIEGTFTAIVRHPGSYVFGLSPASMDSGICTMSQIVPIRADTTITFSLDGHVVEGDVRDRVGQPMVGARVEARGFRIGSADLTDSLGRYRLYLPQAGYRWTVTPKERWIQPRSYDRDSVSTSRRRDFVIAGAAWSGRVRNASTGEPVDSVEIFGYSGTMESASYGDGIFCWSGPDGRFHFVVRPGATFDVMLRDYRVGSVRRKLRAFGRGDGDDRQRLRDYINAQEDQIEREYARVRARVIKGMRAGGDSTFDFTLDPVSRKTPGR